MKLRSGSSSSDCVVGRELMRLMGNDGFETFTISDDSNHIMGPYFTSEKVIPAYLIYCRSAVINDSINLNGWGKSHMLNHVTRPTL